MTELVSLVLTDRLSYLGTSLYSSGRLAEGYSYRSTKRESHTVNKITRSHMLAIPDMILCLFEGHKSHVVIN